MGSLFVPLPWPWQPLVAPCSAGLEPTLEAQKALRYQHAPERSVIFSAKWVRNNRENYL